MGKIFRNMLPYWKSVIAVILLLVVQAMCDLALPQYTSDIIDVGIQNKGIEHILPVKMTEEEYEQAQLFMTEKETETFTSLYKNSGNKYERKELDEKELDEYDEQFSAAILLNHSMSAVEVQTFKKQIWTMMNRSGAELPIDEKTFMDLSVEEIGGMMGIENLSTFRQEITDSNGDAVTADCVDMRKILAQAYQAGRMGKDEILDMRGQMKKTIDAMGSSLASSMGVAYAAKCDKEAGVDVDQIQKTYLWTEGGKMLAISLVMAVVTIFVSFFAARVGAGIGRDLRGKVYQNVMSFFNNEMNRFSTASLITRCTNDVQQIQMVSTMFLRMLAYAPILGIGGIIKVAGTKAGMGWIIGLAVVVIFGFVMVLMSVAMPKFKLMQTLVDKVNLVSREILTGLNVIRAFGRERKEEERFDEANKDLTKTMLFTNRVMTFMMPGMMVLMNATTVLIVWVAAHRIDDGKMQVGAMTAFITYAIMIVMSFLMLTMMSVMLPRAAVAAERIDEVLKTAPSIVNKKDAKTLKKEQVSGVIRFRHVDFKYPGAEQNVLENIDFTAEPGKTTAIIGSTGCGKTTLVQLIPRMYDVTGGEVLLDGQDIRNVKMEDLRDQIGYVPQKGILFSGTIESNLKYGDESASDEAMQEAARIARAEEFIEEKNKKYQAQIAQGGSNVSGGQKQRLSIARAIVKNPKIYIFDDSFSALDLKTDAALRKELASKTQDSTVLIVAQRISTIMHAEQIIVLDDGRIAGKGTHEELLKNCEVYRQIASSQLSAKELGIEEQDDKILPKTGKEALV